MRIHSDSATAAIAGIKTRAQALSEAKPAAQQQPTRAPDSVNFSKFVVRNRAEVAPPIAHTSPVPALYARQVPDPSVQKADPTLATGSTPTPPATAPLPAEATADSAKRLYGDKDLAAVQEAWGSVRGDRAYSTLADPNNDGVVDFDDHNFILANWGRPVQNADDAAQPDLSAPFGQTHLDAIKDKFGARAGEERYTTDADANGDGVIDFNDITHVIANWGQPRTAPGAG